MIDISWLASMGPCKRFAAGQRIPCPGVSDNSERAMYVLLTGRVDVLKASAAGGTQTIGSILPGDVFGGREYFVEVAEFDYSAGVDSAVFLLTESTFNDISWSRPEVLFEVFRGTYMPIRKLTAAEKKANAEAAQLAGAQKAEEAAKAAAAPAQTAQVVAQAAAQNAQQAAPEKKPVVEFFPKGHKGYPGVTKPDYSKLVFTKEYSCPLCKKPFNDFKVFRSKLFESNLMRFDLRRYYTDFQTEWYDVITCPYCFFSTFHNYFSEPKPMQKVKFEKELAAVKESFAMNFGAERNIDFVFASHYIALICADGYLSLGRQIKAKLWGNLSWLYEDVMDEAMEKYSAEKAAEAYEAVYAESRLTPAGEQVTCLSIAGMQYRAGLDNNLKKYLFTAKTIKMGDRTYAKVAEDFMFELSENKQ